MGERGAIRRAQADDPVPAIVVTGPFGAGKSTVAEAVAEVLGHHRIRHALIDMDFLRSVYPHSGGDAFRVQLGLRNLAAIWPSLRDEQIACVVLADVVEHPDQVADFERAMPGARVTIARLDVPMPILFARLEMRETPDAVEAYQESASNLQTIMEKAGVGDIVIDVGEREPHDVAAEILRTSGFLPRL
ncbi:MAG TPA: hypothetical protein VD767_07280 [Thermomicrobiales bacterium]|nr:hypothetical protein [Thermomicrobiales bacterium]